MSATYGIDVAARDDPYVKNADGALDGIVHAAVPGTFWVVRLLEHFLIAAFEGDYQDYLPILKYIPPWFPGASFRRKAEIWKGYSMALLSKPYQEVKKQMENGTCKPSFVYHCLQNIESDRDIDHQEDIIQGTAGTMYIGGTDTTVAALNSFFLAMVLYPDVQKRTQEELDRVIGFGRLPSHSDEADLPYMTAVMYEVLRTQPVTPIGIPHYTTEDDYYRGYYIPKDSVVISNIWAILHDKDMYPDPDTFNPSRWLTPDGTGINTDLRDIMANFGFGRRVCPGAHMALSSTWMTMASVLLTFNISEKVTENGETIKLTGEYESSLQK
ncbi:hypothetical protein VKT23_010873 [Stygiomarasmius scandens]|uniref:Cytochrome P450 n=1 Tax=Marasmiellus scandens TaxID=2682957 RepID=A0ABR1JD28_9AGAR